MITKSRIDIPPELHQAAMKLFEGDVEAAENWCALPLKVLGGLSPAEYASTDERLSRVLDIIKSLEWGVYL